MKPIPCSARTGSAAKGAPNGFDEAQLQADLKSIV